MTPRRYGPLAYLPITRRPKLTEMDGSQERDAVRATIDRIEMACGKRPLGWLGAGLAETWNTLDYLAEAGIRYVCDWVNDDQPYLFEIGSPPLVSLPYSVQTNLPVPRRPARTTAAKSRSAASAPARPAAGRARPSGRKAADDRPDAPRAPPAPSRPKTCPAASASSCRRILLAKSCSAAASPRSSVSPTGRSYPMPPPTAGFFSVSLA